MSFEVRGRKFDTGTHVMGIINVTPDSFLRRPAPPRTKRRNAR